MIAADADRQLLRLGARLKAMYAAQSAAWDACAGLADEHPLTVRASRMNHATGMIVDRIVALPAATVGGILVKALALRWCCSGTPYDPADLVAPGQYVTTDIRIFAGLANDLMRIVRLN